MGFLLGFVTSFLGSIAPSMLNMTALKVSIENGRKEAGLYSIGVSLIVIFQAFLGFFLAEQIEKYPEVLTILEKVAAFIFIALSIYFYFEFKKQKKIKKVEKKSKKNSFLVGIILSTLNMFAIPFYFGVSASLLFFGWLNAEFFSMLLFVIGSSIGTFAILFLYGKFASYVQKKITIITKNINLVLSILTGFIGVFTLLKHIIP